MTNPPPSPLYCANHPTIETSLRCNRCEKPICPKCAVLTPTGYRCKECVRGQQKIFETAQWWDHPIALVVAAVLSGVGSYVATFLGFFTLLIAPVVGMIIAEAVRYCVRRRRSHALFLFAIAGIVLGALPMLFMILINPLISLVSGNAAQAGIGLLPVLWQVLFVIITSTSAYYRLSGIQIR
jgi:hypothetical protein